MTQKTLAAAAIAGLFALGTAGGAALAQGKGQEKGQEKCWGVAKAGQNDCGSNKTAHSCAGQSKADYDPNDFKVVKAGSCVQMGGSLEQGKAGKRAMQKKG